MFDSISMMVNTFWRRDTTKFVLLQVLVTNSLLCLSSVTGGAIKCNTKTVIPEVYISSSPPDRTQPIGAAISLICEAWPRAGDELLPRRSIKYIEWYGPNGTRTGVKCSRKLPIKKLSCPLLLKNLTEENFGNYTCEAENDYTGYCRRKSVEIRRTDNWARIVEDPVNQTSFFGSNVTFNCSAAGLPKPIISWFKNNNSNALDSNPRARVIQMPLEDKTITQSQLSIRGVKEKDEGQYYCVTKGSAEEAASKYAFLSIKHLGQLPYPATAPPRKERHRSVSLITALSVFGGTMITSMCGCTIAFLYRRARSNEGHRDGKEIYVTCTTFKDLAEGIPKHENANTNGSAPSVVNIVAPLEDVENRNTSTRLERKYHAQDDGNADSILRALSEGSKIPTPPDVGDKHFRNPIFEKHDHAEKLLNSRSGHLNAAYSFGDVNLNLHQDSGMNSDKHSDQMLTPLNIKLKECEKGVDDLEVLDEVLGEGEYGIVYKGRYGGKNGSITDVAVKKLKDNAGILAKAALLNEIRTLKQAGRHPNIVNLIGTWTHGETTLVVTELVRGGSLESLLRSRDDGSSEYANVCCKLNDRQLLNIALQVAFGMQHLEERKCIHCDLAARNVFINPNMVAKVGDFGLARNISDDGLYIKTSCGKVPWRWSSLESLRDRVYTSQSDVWSFGILLWEIATYGKVPYPDIESPFSLVSRLSTGYRMPRPHQCSEELYTLMSSCWNENPLTRPSFTDIVNRLEYFLREVKRTYINIMEDDIRVDEK